MKAAILALSAAALLPLATLRGQSGSPFVETTTLTFYWGFTETYISNATTPIPALADFAVFDPNSLPSGFGSYTDTLRAAPYAGASSTGTPSGANSQIIDLLLQRMVRTGQIGKLALGYRWQLIAVRETPANVKELATNPYRVFLSGQAPVSTKATSIEVAGFGADPVIDDPQRDQYFAATVSPSGVVTLDTGITITLGQYNGSYTETNWGNNDNRVRKAVGNVATAFRVNFGALFYDDPLHAQSNPSRHAYNYHLKRHYWQASAAGLINYNIRTILPSADDSWLPTFAATNSSATATGWFYHEYDEFTGELVDDVPVYKRVIGAAYGGYGTAPLKVTLSTIQYQKRDRFELGLPLATTSISTETIADGVVEVSWSNASTNETGFLLERSLTPTGPWELAIKTNANGTPYDDPGLALDTVYYYRVAAFNGGGVADYSDSAVASTVAAPFNLDAGALDDGGVKLNWLHNSTVETGYQIQRRRDKTNVWETLIPIPNPPPPTTLPPDTLTFTDTTTSSDTKYFYRVRALHAPYGASAWSNIDDATTPKPGQ